MLHLIVLKSILKIHIQVCQPLPLNFNKINFLNLYYIIYYQGGERYRVSEEGRKGLDLKLENKLNIIY